MKPVLMSWSGGKDSCVALHELQRSEDWHVTGLLTTVTRGLDRISMHGVRTELLDRQAAALDLPVDRVSISASSDNNSYESAMGSALDRHVTAGTRTVAFGDLFLADIRAYRERTLGAQGLEAVFPVWGRDTRAFAHDFITAGFRAVLVCVDPAVLDPGFAGREFDRELLADLPQDVDPCGENGEFHTFVFDGPNFRAPVAIEVGSHVVRDGFAFCELLPGK